MATAARAGLLALLVAAPAASSAAAPDWTAGAPVDLGGLALDPAADMRMLYERTIFRVDVLELSLRFDTATAGRIRSLVDGRRFDDTLADTVTSAAFDARDVLVRSRFLRDVSLDQYLDGVADNLEDARKAGYLTRQEQREIVGGLADTWAPIQDSGLRSGDSVWYRIDGEQLHVAVQRSDGSVTLDLRFEGPQHRRAILGSYLAPRSDFRDRLIRSLLD